MRIVDLRAVQPPTPGAPQDWRTQLGQIIVRVETDDGLWGLGVGGGGAAGIHLVETVFRDLLLGRQADNVEGLHAAMCRHTEFYGRKGLAVMALSGIDLALWDLRGKREGISVARLLNPRVDFSRSIPTYVTIFDEQDAAAALADGHAAVKLHVERLGDRPKAQELAELVARVRVAIGPQRPLMLDAFGRWDLATSLAVAEAIAPFNIHWLEEPLGPDDLDGYARLAAHSRVPIAGGEHEYLVQGFRPLIERRLHAVLQPDINWCGGLTTLVEIYRLARAVGIKVCPHRGCEPYALAAIAALDEQAWAESPRRWFNCLTGAPQIEAGVVRPRDAAGFGVDVDPALWKS